ncbi:MAG TPA: zinc ribbon domain-containing protein [Pirellulales bacterium]|nr:zinc ribbon domain-containing protein [Pirellulales bacterium]
MPLYEYACQACGQLQEHLVRSSESPVCSSCGSPRLTKLLSAPVAHTGGSNSASSKAPEWGGCGRPGCGPAGCAGLG